MCAMPQMKLKEVGTDVLWCADGSVVENNDVRVDLMTLECECVMVWQAGSGQAEFGIRADEEKKKANVNTIWGS